MSMQSVASPAMTLTPPKRNSLTHIPGDEGWPIVGKTLEVLADPKGQAERQAAKYGLIYRSHLFGETSHNLAQASRLTSSCSVPPVLPLSYPPRTAGDEFSACCFLSFFSCSTSR